MPLAIAGLALGAAGAGLQILGNQKSQNSMNNTRQTENQLQSDLQSRNNALVKKSIAANTAGNAQAQIAKGATSRSNAWQQLNTATTPIASALPATSTTDGTTTGKASKRANTAGNAWNTLTADAAAKVGGYGDWQNNQSTNNSNVNNKLMVNNNFSRADANLLPLEMDVASQAGGKLSGWGGIISTLGNIAGLASSSGLFKSPVDANGVPIANDAGALKEFNGGAGGEFTPTTLPASNDSALSRIYG